MFVTYLNFFIFMLIILSVGVISSMWYRDTYRDYAVAKGKFSEFSLVASIVGTLLGARIFMGGSQNAIMNGFASIIPALCIWITFYLNAKLIIPRLKPYMFTLSLPQTMRIIYNPFIQFLGAISFLILDICLLVIEFTILQKVFSIFLGVREEISLIIVAIVMGIYTMKGGIVAVVMTDVLQYGVFVIGLPVILYSLLNVDTWNQLSNIGQYENFNLKEYFYFTSDEFKLERCILLFSLIFTICFPCLDLSRYQRILSCVTTQQAQSVFIKAGVILFFLYIIMVSIIMVVLVQNPLIKEGDIIINFLTILQNTVLGPFVLIVILAMSMSTIDSVINVTSIIAVNDILYSYQYANAKDDDLIRKSKLSAIIITLLAACIVLVGIEKSLIQIVYFGSQGYIAAVQIPLLLHIFRFEFSNNGTALGILLSWIMILVLKIGFSFNSIHGFVTVIFVTPFLIALSHYFLERCNQKKQL